MPNLLFNSGRVLVEFWLQIFRFLSGNYPWVLLLLKVFRKVLFYASCALPHLFFVLLEVSSLGSICCLRQWWTKNSPKICHSAMWAKSSAKLFSLILGTLDESNISLSVQSFTSMMARNLYKTYKSFFFLHLLPGVP